MSRRIAGLLLAACALAATSAALQKTNGKA